MLGAPSIVPVVGPGAMGYPGFIRVSPVGDLRMLPGGVKVVPAAGACREWSVGLLFTSSAPYFQILTAVIKEKKRGRESFYQAPQSIYGPIFWQAIRLRPSLHRQRFARPMVDDPARGNVSSAPHGASCPIAEEWSRKDSRPLFPSPKVISRHSRPTFTVPTRDRAVPFGLSVASWIRAVAVCPAFKPRSAAW